MSQKYFKTVNICLHVIMLEANAEWKWLQTKYCNKTIKKKAIF